MKYYPLLGARFLKPLAICSALVLSLLVLNAGAKYVLAQSSDADADIALGEAALDNSLFDPSSYDIDVSDSLFAVDSDISSQTNSTSVGTTSFSTTTIQSALAASVATSSLTNATSNACELSSEDMLSALGKTEISIGQLARNGQVASVSVTNNSSCLARISIAAYSEIRSSSQNIASNTIVLFDRSQVASIPAGTSQTISVNLPICESEVGVYAGLPPTTLGSPTLDGSLVSQKQIVDSDLCAPKVSDVSAVGSSANSTTTLASMASSTGIIVATSTGVLNPVLLASAGTTTCPFLNSYLQYGVNNDPAEVARLQSFLQKLEGIDVEVNGTFDDKTLSGVHSFQRKYMSEVMGPWGASQSSGYVFITTKNLINKMACGENIAIDTQEQSVIDSWVSAHPVAEQLETAKAVSASSPELVSAAASTSAEIASESTGDPDNGNDELFTAGAGNVSVVGNFWSFLKGIFER